MTLKCTCKSQYQDSQQGAGNRLHNPMVKDGKVTGYRCTVCGKETKV